MILVTGAGGMLGRDVCYHNSLLRKHDVTAFTRRELDITDAGAVQAALAHARPDVVIHCAAYTNVNGAEADAETAFRVNATGTRNIAEACAGVGSRMVFVSTDYVFDGAKGTAYVETDPINPLSVYGKSKAEGESWVRQILPDRHVIARTSWLYGGAPETKNFVRTIQRLARTLPEVPVVADQWGCPTETFGVAIGLTVLAEDFIAGTYHLVCEGQASWFEFAQEIVRLSGLQTPVLPITTEEYAARFGPQAPRPAFSPLECAALHKRGMRMPYWKDALAAFLQA